MKKWDDFTTQRRLAFVRNRCQATFREEPWTLSFWEYCQFWHDPKVWGRRGRLSTDLVLSRLHNQGPWSSDNCVIMTRYHQLCANRRIRDRDDPTEFYQGSRNYEQYKDKDPKIRFRDRKEHPDPNRDDLAEWFPGDTYY